jgi:hypothetical protein
MALERKMTDVLLDLKLVTVIGILLILSAFAGSILYPRTASACGSKIVVRDYLKPLDRMLPIQEPSASGKMPFAPKTMKLSVSGGQLIANNGSVGFGLRDEAFNHRHRLDWIVETELFKVNRRGKVITSLEVKRRRVVSIYGNRIRDFLHRLSGGPAFYRVDIRFLRRGTGRVIGTYSTYARVVKARPQLQMQIKSPTVLPGEYARATLVNLGTVPIEFRSWNYGFRVSAFLENQWRTVPHNPPMLVPKRLRRPYFLPAGTETRGCLRYLVPSDQAPGLFRFSTLGRYGENWTKLVQAEFEVKAP